MKTKEYLNQPTEPRLNALLSQIERWAEYHRVIGVPAYNKSETPYLVGLTRFINMIYENRTGRPGRITLQ